MMSREFLIRARSFTPNYYRAMLATPEKLHPHHATDFPHQPLIWDRILHQGFVASKLF